MAAVITVPWDVPRPASVKGILDQPSGKRMLKPGTRDTILLAIAKARSWIDDFASGRVQSFAEIAHREGKVERHIRLLAPLAFTPPALLAEIIAGSAPNNLTVTTLAQAIPYAWERGI
jgi:site-specific DNA recombinase